MKPNPSNTSIFSIALCLESPWYVEEVKLLDNQASFCKELHIYILQEVTNLFCPMVVWARVMIQWIRYGSTCIFPDSMFLDIFQTNDSEEAKFDLEYWCELAIELGIQPFIKFVDLLKGYWSGDW